MKNNLMTSFSEQDRLDLFQNTARKLKIQPAMVEKDFWVYCVLNSIFSNEELAQMLCFKGGTSLSKAFHLIDRFSEDIDLILAQRLILKEGEVLQRRTKNQQDKFLKELNERTAQYITMQLKDKIAHVLDGCLEVYTDAEYAKLEPDYDSNNPRKTTDGNLHIVYPRAIKDDYLRPDILLEIGPLSLWNPNERYQVTSFVADTFPALDIKPAVVPTIKPERTFWEKILILHYEHTRPENKPLRSRYSRHYYDLFKMGSSWVLADALQHKKLLLDTVSFDNQFYSLPWADYESVRHGKLHIMPSVHHSAALEGDYRRMQKMLFDQTTSPKWQDIIEHLQKLERIINDH